MGGGISRNVVEDNEMRSTIEPNFLENYLEKKKAIDIYSKPSKKGQSNLLSKINFRNPLESSLSTLELSIDHSLTVMEFDRDLLHTDIKELKNEFKSLVLTSTWMEAMKNFFDDSNFSISIYEVDHLKHYNPIVCVNKSFTKLTGYKPVDIVHKNHENLLYKRTEREQKDLIFSSLNNGKSLKIPLTNQSLYGRNVNNLLILRPSYTSQNEYKFMVGIHCDLMNNMSMITYAEKLSRIISYILSA